MVREELVELGHISLDAKQVQVEGHKKKDRAECQGFVNRSGKQRVHKSHRCLPSYQFSHRATNQSLNLLISHRTICAKVVPSSTWCCRTLLDLKEIFSHYLAMTRAMMGLRPEALLRPQKWRSFSSAAAAVASASVAHDTTSPPSAPTIGSTIGASRSASFIGGLSQTHFASFHKPVTSDASLVKQEISALLQAKRFDALLKVLGRWTSQRGAEWQHTLTHSELSHILAKLVAYQVGLLTKAGAAKLVDSASMHTSSRLAHAHSVRQKIRQVYGNLVFGEGGVSHVYAREHRGRLQSAVNLSVRDYENLITLEVNNGKLDLASKWFQRFEQQHPDGTHYRHMTHRLWLLRFQVYGGALPALWTVEATDLYEVELNPRRSRLCAEQGWLEIFNDFISHQALMLGNQNYVFERSVLSAMLYSIAYSRNVDQLTKIIELNWGISTRGSMAPRFEKPRAGDPLYPNIDILKTIVVSMVYNKEYVRSMAYMNGFQDHYGINLGHSSSKHFWDLIFRWCEIQTRFSEYRALQHFIQKTATTLLKPADATEVGVTLQEAQRSADFDYEGYLKFVGDLRNQRTKLIGELWKGYHECQPGFSVRVYRTQLLLLTEHFDESRCYDFLSALAKQYHLHYVSLESFNRSMVEGRLAQICQLYGKGMKLLINAKGSNGDLGLISVIIDKWALDKRMHHKLSEWAASQQERFLQNAHERRVSMEQSEEDDDGFLGLMS